MLKRLTFVAIAAALAWAGHWYWGAQTLKSGFAHWETERREDGWQISYADMSLSGFPNRHDTTWSDLQIENPQSGWGWQAPFFQLFLLSYNRHHAIAIWPPTQTISTSQGDYHLQSDSLQASLITEGSDYMLKRSNLVVDVLNVTGPKSDALAMAQLRGAMSQVEGSPNEYDLSLQIDGLALSAPTIRTAKSLSDAFQDTSLRARVTLAEPWQLGADATGMPPVTDIDLAQATLIWGPMSLRAAGKAKVDRKGEIEGKLTLRAENWRQMLRLAGKSEQVPQGILDTIEARLELIAQISRSGKNLDIKLSFRDGRSYLGVIPIGPAPRLR